MCDSTSKCPLNAIFRVSVMSGDNGTRNMCSRHLGTYIKSLFRTDPATRILVTRSKGGEL